MWYISLKNALKLIKIIFLSISDKFLLSVQRIISEIVSGLLSSNFYWTEIVITTTSEKHKNSSYLLDIFEN